MRACLEAKQMRKGESVNARKKQSTIAVNGQLGVLTSLIVEVMVLLAASGSCSQQSLLDFIVHRVAPVQNAKWSCKDNVH